MPNYRRLYQPHSTYFFTVVTYNRHHLFDKEEARVLFRNVILDVQKQWPFEIAGFVLLPEHIHTLWTLPEEDSNFSMRWKLIKSNFTRLYLEKSDTHLIPTGSRSKKQEQLIWQRRFWEHMVRDERDLHKHLDYIHYNPVKHGYVYRPWDWEWSTFRRYVTMNWYEPNWGESEPKDLLDHCLGE